MAVACALRVSLLVRAISGGKGSALSGGGYKGENDGLELTGLVGKREQKGGGAAKAGLLWKGTTAFVINGVYSEPREPWSRPTCISRVQSPSSPSPSLGTCRTRESTEADDNRKSGW